MHPRLLERDLRPALTALRRSLQHAGNSVPGAATARGDFRPVQPDTVQLQYFPVVGRTHDLLNEYCTCKANADIHYTGCSTAAESLLNAAGFIAQFGRLGCSFWVGILRSIKGINNDLHWHTKEIGKDIAANRGLSGKNCPPAALAQQNGLTRVQLKVCAAAAFEP